MRRLSVLVFLIVLYISRLYAQNDSDTLQFDQVILKNEAIITGTRYQKDIRHLPMSISVINETQLANRKQLSVLPILNEQVPGLFITSRGIMGYGVAAGAAGGMRLRGIGGAPTTGLLVLIDGIPQYMGLMGHPIADAYQTTSAERIEVVRGPASVIYGSKAMGGVINIVTPKLTRDTVFTNFRLNYGPFNSLESLLSNRIQEGRFNSKLAVSYNRTDGHRENMEFGQLTGYAKLGYNLSNQWNINTSFNLTHFDASNPGTLASPLIDNDSEITRGMATLSVENDYHLTLGAARFYYNWGKHIINDGFAQGGQPRDFLFHSNDKMLGVSVYQTAIFLPNNRITIGFDYRMFGGRAEREFTDNRIMSLVDTTLSEVAGYINVRQGIGSFLTLDAGLRFDNHSRTGSQWIPQAGASLHLPNSLVIKALASRGFRNPTIRELFMFPPQNPDLMPESLMNYEISIAQRIFVDRLAYSLSVFYIAGDNIIQTVPVGGRPLNVNTGEIRNSGIEASVTYIINNNWTVNTNYSWLNMEFPVLAAPEHKIFLGMEYTNQQIRVSTGVQYVSGLYTTLNPAEISNFVLWSVRGSYQINRHIGLFVSGENLLNQAYEIHAGYPMPKATFFAGLNFHF
ncbi:MAG TPA: TonB-dependent receptor [Bacteroidales bacterium]|nr:TonB-dependent receptor [Bacteroidales bacterium]